MEIFKYGKKEMDFLSKQDQQLGNYIQKIGHIQRQVNPDFFSALINNIIGQQISTKAAQTVKNRLVLLLGDLTPAALNNANVTKIQSCGMSVRKATNIKAIGDKVCSGALNLEKIVKLPDDEVIKTLTELGGVGVWTAEMLLMFSLQRKNILSYGDLGIRGGLCKLYGLEKLSKKEFTVYKERFAPYGTVASFYLWDIWGQG